MLKHYILDEDRRVTEVDLDTRATWFDDFANRIVCQTDVGGGVRVSTMFLGLDHQWGAGPPPTFETMVSTEGDRGGEECYRYSSWSEAEAGHEATVKRSRWRERVRRAAKLAGSKDGKPIKMKEN
jgi:hypothetical protein